MTTKKWGWQGESKYMADTWMESLQEVCPTIWTFNKRAYWKEIYPYGKGVILGWNLSRNPIGSRRIGPRTTGPGAQFTQNHPICTRGFIHISTMVPLTIYLKGLWGWLLWGDSICPGWFYWWLGFDSYTYYTYYTLTVHLKGMSVGLTPLRSREMKRSAQDSTFTSRTWVGSS